MRFKPEDGARVFFGVFLLAAATIPLRRLVTGGETLDLHIYLRAGIAAVHGNHVYDTNAVAIRHYGFTYPPFAAYLFGVFGPLGLGLSEAVITACSFVCLFAIIAVADPTVLPRMWCGVSLGAAGLVLFAVLSQPFRTNLWNGQINVVLVALILLDLGPGVRRNRWRGVLIGIAAAIKLTPLIFLPFFLVTGRVREARNAAAVFAALSVVGSAIHPGQARTYWLDNLPHGVGIGDGSRLSNQSLLGVFDRSFGTGVVASVMWVAVAPIVFALGLWLAQRMAVIFDDVVAGSVVGLTGCLVSPVSWSHHWIWFVPAVTALLRLGLTNGPKCILICICAYLVGINWVPQSAIDHNAWLFDVCSVIYAAITTCLFVLGALAVEKAASDGSPDFVGLLGRAGRGVEKALRPNTAR